MNLLLIILIVLLVVGVPGGWRYGGPYLGGGVGLVVLDSHNLGAIGPTMRTRHSIPGSSTDPGRRRRPGEVSYELRREGPWSPPQADDGAISGLGSIAEHSNTAVSPAHARASPQTRAVVTDRMRIPLLSD